MGFDKVFNQYQGRGTNVSTAGYISQNAGTISERTLNNACIHLYFSILYINEQYTHIESRKQSSKVGDKHEKHGEEMVIMKAITSMKQWLLLIQVE